MFKSRSLILPALTIALALTVSHTARSDDWPQWRGPYRDGVSRETGLLKQWPADGPAIVWQVDGAGVGYSSLAVKDGRVITQGDLDGVEHIIAFSEEDGSLLWAVQPAPIVKALDQRVAEQFNRFDKNGDGRLDEQEALAGLGWNFNNFDTPVEGDSREIARRRVATLLKELDQNSDGRLGPDEIPEAMQREASRIDQEDKSADAKALAEGRAKAFLKQFDANGDGRISRRESRDAVSNQVFRLADQASPGATEGDGELTAEELAAYYLSREPGRDGEITAGELEEYYVKSFPGQDGILVKADLRRYYGGYRNSYGDGPRGTPTLDGGRVYAEGGSGDVTCLDAATGETLWHANLSADLGGGRPGWGYAESPLIVGELVIVTPGGNNGTLAALDKNDGSVVWRSSAMKEAAQYASPQLAEIAGVKQIVQFARNSVFGVRLDGGAPLWSYSAANNGTANVATPIIAGDRVLSSSGYGTGTGVVKIAAGSGGQQQADEVFFQKKLQNHHGGLVKVGDYVYGFGNGLMCMHFETGEIAWQDRSVGKGSLIAADRMLYCLGERYEIALVEATPDEYRERGRFKIDAFSRPSWAHPVVANGRLYIRNFQRLTAYDVRAK